MSWSSIVALGLAFDFINGFHDTANAIATSVATRVLSPAQAVAMAAVLNVAGALTGTAVAEHRRQGDHPDPSVATQQLVVAALLSAIAWNLVTWWYGIPSSSSHALVFSIVGAGAAAAGADAIEVDGVDQGPARAWSSRRCSGFLGAFLILFGLLWLVARSAAARWSAGSSAGCRSSRPPSWPSATAATTPRRRWA